MTTERSNGFDEAGYFHGIDFQAFRDPDQIGKEYALSGEMDARSSEDVMDAVMAEVFDTETTDPLILDLHGIVYLDSKGLHDLIDVYRRMETRSRELKFRNPSPMARRVLEITNMIDLVPIIEDSNE